MNDIIELAKKYPAINLTVTAGELLELANYCILTTRKELEQKIAEANAERFPSLAQVSEILGVNKSTLWRWQKQGYLMPIEVGGKRRYRMSDVKKILNKK